MKFKEERLKLEQIKEKIRAKAAEFDVQDYQEFDVEGKCSYTDLFIIMTGSSSTNIKALTDKIVFECKHAGLPPLSIEGAGDGEWCLLDFGSVIVNIMMSEKRAHYKLESIWDQMG